MMKEKEGKVGKAKAQEETSSLDFRDRFLAGRDRIQEKEVNDKEIYQSQRDEDGKKWRKLTRETRQARAVDGEKLHETKHSKTHPVPSLEAVKASEWSMTSCVSPLPVPPGCSLHDRLAVDASWGKG